jgi:hypothetical protein
MGYEGAPFQPGNKMGQGRPRGSRNKRSRQAQEVLNRYGASIVTKAVSVALEPEKDEMGRPKEPVKRDRSVLRQLVGKALASTKELPVKIGPLPMGTAQELSQSFEKVMKKLSSGQISVSEAQGIAALMEVRRRVIETESLEGRLRALEQNQGVRPPAVAAPPPSAEIEANCSDQNSRPSEEEPL